MQTLPQIDQVLRKGIDAGDVPGVVAMAATRDGPVYEGAFGTRALPDGAAMTPDTVFWIASMTKAITSTAAMQLVERGKLSLDAPISDVLPELAVAAGAGRLRCRGRAEAAPGRRGRSRCATCSPTPRASATTSGTPTSARYMETHGHARHHQLRESRR